MRRHIVAGLAVIGLVAAALVAPATAADIALSFNPTYVDTGPPPGGEATNLRDTLVELGHNVTTFTGITASDISAATAGKQVLMFPELEVRDLSPDLDLNADAAIAFFVNNQGGTLIVSNQGDGDPLAIINEAFSFGAQPPNQAFHLTAVAVVGTTATLTAAAAGTPFAGGPASLPLNNATTAVLASSVPSGGKIIYADSAGNGVVVFIPSDGAIVGQGNIVILGWDWFDATTVANPTGQPSAEWRTVLDTAINIPSAGAVIPTLSEWAMIAMAGLLLLVGLRTLNHHPRIAAR